MKYVTSYASDSRIVERDAIWDAVGDRRAPPSPTREECDMRWRHHYGQQLKELLANKPDSAAVFIQCIGELCHDDELPGRGCVGHGRSGLRDVREALRASRRDGMTTWVL